MDFPSRQPGGHHGQVGFPTGAGKRCRHVTLLTGGGGHSQDLGGDGGVLGGCGGVGGQGGEKRGETERGGNHREKRSVKKP